MCENLYGVCFGGPFRNHWEIGGITYGPGEVFEQGASADEEWKAKVWSQLCAWDLEMKRHLDARRRESRFVSSKRRR